MWRVIATYPLDQMAKITASTTKAAGIPVSPVGAEAVGITPAATVSGATPARTKNSTAGTPSRSRASACDTEPCRLVRAWAGNVIVPPSSSRGCHQGSGAVGEHGRARGGLRHADHVLQ